MKVAVVLALLVVCAVFSADAVKNAKRRKQRKALRLNQKGLFGDNSGPTSTLPKIKSGKACISTDRVLTGECLPWVFARTPIGTVPLEGKTTVVRDLDEGRTWLEMEALGLDTDNHHLAAAFSYPCEIMRGGPLPYQHFEHGVEYGLSNYTGSTQVAPFAGFPKLEFDGNYLNATRAGTSQFVSQFTSIVWNNGGQFEYIARNAIQSIVVFEGVDSGTGNMTNTTWSRLMCCNLEAKTKKKTTVTKAKKETKTTKKQAS